MLLILCASIAFAASLDNSLDHKDVVMMRSIGIQEEYISERSCVAMTADSVDREPINTRSGYRRSWIADPFHQPLNRGRKNLSQELRIRKNIEMHSRSGIRLQHHPHTLRGATRYSTLLHNNFRRLRRKRNMSRRRFYCPIPSILPPTSGRNIPQISGHPATEAAGLGRGTDTHENEFGFPDSGIHVGTKHQVLVAHRLYDVP